MITIKQVKDIAKKLKIDESTVAREYFQLIFLNELYSNSFSNEIYFKGGTSIRLIYGGSRFSEDLDFTVNYDQEIFEKDIEKLFTSMSNRYLVQFKSRDSIAGKTYLATFTLPEFKTPLYIKLDFSFREEVFRPVKKTVKTDYPIIFSSFVNVYDIDEIVAEKIRALMTRNKQRDLYDLWILINLGGKVNLELVNKKLEYYNIKYNRDEFITKLEQFNQSDFIKDLKPFIPTNERENLAQLHTYIKEYLKTHLE